MAKASDEVHNHLLADLKSEVLQRALVDRLPQHRSFADVCQSLNDFLETIQQEISWVVLYVYGAYDQFMQLFQTLEKEAEAHVAVSSTTTPSDGSATKTILFAW